MGSKAILYCIKRFGKRLTSPQQWSLKDLIPHGMLSIMITILKRCTKNCYFFIVIFPFMLSQSKNDQKCIVYPSHADILLQHYIISPLCVLWGKNGLRDECGVEFNKGQEPLWAPVKGNYQSLIFGCYAILTSPKEGETAVYAYNPALFWVLSVSCWCLAELIFT